MQRLLEKIAPMRSSCHPKRMVPGYRIVDGEVAVNDRTNIDEPPMQQVVNNVGSSKIHSAPAQVKCGNESFVPALRINVTLPGIALAAALHLIKCKPQSGNAESPPSHPAR